MLLRISPAVWVEGLQSGGPCWRQTLGRAHCPAAQVVAGTNYKLLLSVADASNQKKNLEVTVYGAHRPLLSSSLAQTCRTVSC